MGKIKLNKKDNFTIISNSVLKNANLTLKAKGLYAYMWSLPDDWDYSVAGLTKVLKEGKDAINEALKELEREGYLVRTILRSGGKFSDMDYILPETPQRVPFTENPQAEKPFTENPQQINTNKTNKEKKKDPLPTVEGEQALPEKKRSYTEILSAEDNKYVREALEKFIKYCRGKNYTPKVTTVTEFAKVLRENAGEDPVTALAIVDQSIDNGWKALYPLKKYGKQKTATAVSKPVEGDTVRTY